MKTTDKQNTSLYPSTIKLYEKIQTIGHGAFGTVL